MTPSALGPPPSHAAVFGATWDGVPSDLGSAGSDRDRLLWVAPGSRRAGEAFSAWQSGGWRALVRVPGPWAIAVGDAQERTITVLHDAAGAMPLYWGRTLAGGVLAATQLPTFADHPQVRASLDAARVATRQHQWASGFETLSITDFSDIDAVPFGHGIVVQADGTVVQRPFWRPRHAARGALSAANCASELDDVLAGLLRRAAADLEGRTVAILHPPRPELLDRLAQDFSARDVRICGVFSLFPMAEDEPCSAPNGGLWRHEPVTMESRRRLRRLDYHRYYPRSMDALAVDLPAARSLGATTVVTLEGLDLLEPDLRGVLTGQLARGALRQAAGTLRGLPAQQRRAALLRSVRGAFPWLARASRTVRRPSRPDHTTSFAAAIPARMVDEERVRFLRARSSSEFRLALIDAGETWRRHEATVSLAGALGLDVYAPLLDAQAIQRVLELPDRTAQGDGAVGRAFDEAMATWRRESSFTLGFPGRVQTDEAASLAAEAALPPRVWSETDPGIAEVLRDVGVRREITHEPYVHPSRWPEE